MANPPPMLPGLGFPVDSEIDLLRKWTWNTWLWAQEDFQPEDIPGLGLDLDASYGVLNSIGPDVPATNGQSVRRWLDKSGNGRNYDQPTATGQPLFLTASFNGLSCVDFDGMNDVMTSVAAQGLSADVGGFTMIAVCASDALSGPRNAVFFSGGVSDTRAAILHQSPNWASGGRRLAADSFQSVSLGAVVVGESVIISAIFRYAEASLSAYRNGVESVLSPFQTAGLTPAINSNIAAVGAGGSANQFDGKIARVLVWPRALTAPELLRIHRYLSATYGIPLAS